MNTEHFPFDFYNTFQALSELDSFFHSNRGMETIIYTIIVVFRCLNIFSIFLLRIQFALFGIIHIICKATLFQCYFSSFVLVNSILVYAIIRYPHEILPWNDYI